MGKRVKQHQLEDLSRSKYSLILPRHWVCRNKDKDYGIDIEVEIFDKDNINTGLVYWVQLKATDSNDQNSIKKVNLSVESIKYYQKLEVPVLIVRYSAKTDIFYYCWAHKIDLFHSKRNAKTITINFRDEDIWDDLSYIKITKYLEKIKSIKNGRFKLPLSINVDIKSDIINGIPKGVFISSLRTVLGEFPELISFTNECENALYIVSLQNNELKIGLSLIRSFTLHDIKKIKKEKFIETVAEYILYGCAITLAQLGQKEMAAQIVLNNRLKSDFIQNSKVLIILIPYLLQTSYFKEIIDTVIRLIDSQKDDIVEIITASCAIYEFNPNDKEKLSQIENLLKKILEKYESKKEISQIGTCHYNLGNHYRRRRLCKKAIFHYLQARKYEKKYLNQFYYYGEFAGALFESRKYHFSSILYKKALDNGASESTKPLYADALMYSGKYQQALEIFTEYINSTKDRNDIWHLKKYCLSNLIAKFNIKEQKRKINDALKLIDFNTTSPKDYTKLLETALKMDMLCGLAWFNMGIEQSQIRNYKDACFSFTICGLIQTGDIEAWTNALLCCISNKEEIWLFPLILRTSYFYNGDLLLSNLYTEAGKQMKSEILTNFSNVIEKLLPKIPPNKEKPIIRLMDKNGIFKNISEMKKV